MNKIREFDFYPKIQNDLPIRHTMCGGILFVFTLILIAFLLSQEFYYSYIIGKQQIEQQIDNSNLDERVKVNLNITFHKTPCSVLSLDLQDVTGGHLEDVRYTLHKLRLASNGSFLSQDAANKIRNFELQNRKEQIENNCFGAQLYEEQNCFTCQDVMLAYVARGWPQPSRELISQCRPYEFYVSDEYQFPTENKQFSSNNEKANPLLMEDNIRQREKLMNIEHREFSTEGLNINKEAFSSLTTEEKSKQFMNTLKDLQELRYTTDQKSLQKEKIEDLLSLMDGDLAEIDQKINRQVFWSVSDKVLFKKTVPSSIIASEIKRKDCTQQLEVTIQMIINSQKFIVSFSKGDCSIPVNISKISPEELQVTIQNFTYNWKTQLEKDDSMISLEFEIIETAPTERMFDSFKKYFRIHFSDYSKQRILYEENFGREKAIIHQFSLKDFEKIKSQQNEGCQFFGHFYIKKVPGNFHISFHGKGEIAVFFGKQYSLEHTINLLQFTDSIRQEGNILDEQLNQAKIEEDIEYYLKLVTIKSNDLKDYKFTVHQTKHRQIELLPQVVFKYEFDAIAMYYYHASMNIWQLLAKFFAIIGGVFSVSLLAGKLLDRFGM